MRPRADRRRPPRVGEPIRIERVQRRAGHGAPRRRRSGCAISTAAAAHAAPVVTFAVVRGRYATCPLEHRSGVDDVDAIERSLNVDAGAGSAARPLSSQPERRTAKFDGLQMNRKSGSQRIMPSTFARNAAASADSDHRSDVDVVHAEPRFDVSRSFAPAAAPDSRERARLHERTDRRARAGSTRCRSTPTRRPSPATGSPTTRGETRASPIERTLIDARADVGVEAGARRSSELRVRADAPTRRARAASAARRPRASSTRRRACALRRRATRAAGPRRP